MQKWEYLMLFRGSKEWLVNGNPIGKNIFDVTAIIIDGKKTHITNYINQLGAEGWELATQPSFTMFVFKRPIPEPPPKLDKASN